VARFCSNAARTPRREAPADVIGNAVKVMRIANFVRIHKTLRTWPAMAAGIEKRLWSMEDIVALIDARSEKVSGATLLG
jgi:hypothetical protein